MHPGKRSFPGEKWFGQMKPVQARIKRTRIGWRIGRSGLMRRIGVWFFVALAASVCGLLSGAHAFTDTVKDLYIGAEAVFIGRLEDVQVSSRHLFVFPAEYAVTLSVQRAWKGAGPGSVTVTRDNRREEGGSLIARGESYLVITSENASWIKDIEDAKDELDYLNSIYLSVPQPSGPYAVGTKNFCFVDSSRPESFTPAPDDYREVAFRVWYPVLRVDDERLPVPLLENASELGQVYATYLPLPPGTLDVLSSVETHSYRDADMLESTELFPVVLFSHGYGAGMMQSTVLMEELASHGYVVVSVAHAYETSPFLGEDGIIKGFDPGNEEFLLRAKERSSTLGIQREIVATQDPHELELLLREHSERRPKTIESLRIWADDVSFVLDKLEEMSCGGGFFGGKLDTGRVGVLGHSFGGAASAQVCLTDERCLAGINIDGLGLGDILDENLAKPFMFVHHDNIAATNKTPNRLFFERSEGPGYLVLVEGTRHLNFSDASIPGYASIFLLPAETLGEIDGRRCLEIQNRYVTAFFDKHLRGLDSHLLDGLASGYPEVQIWTRFPESPGVLTD